MYNFLSWITFFLGVCVDLLLSKVMAVIAKCSGGRHFYYFLAVLMNPFDILTRNIKLAVFATKLSPNLYAINYSAGLDQKILIRIYTNGVDRVSLQ